jgi:hypothetical protein
MSAFFKGLYAKVFNPDSRNDFDNHLGMSFSIWGDGTYSTCSKGFGSRNQRLSIEFGRFDITGEVQGQGGGSGFLGHLVRALPDGIAVFG